MTKDAKRFIQGWMSENVNVEGHPEVHDTSAAEALVAECQRAAEKEGISAKELDEAAADMIGGGDNLLDLMINATQKADDHEVQHQADIED